MAFKIINLLFCLNNLRAETIEIWILILSILGMILNILGIIFIPWNVTSKIMHILFIIALIFICLSFLICAIIINLRKIHKLGKRSTRILIFALILVIFICFFSLIIFIILAFGIFSDLDNKVKETIEEVIEETGEILSVTETEKRLCSKTKKVITILIIVALMVIWIFLLFLWVSEYIRLIYNIDCSYTDYVKNEQKNELKHPIQYGYNVVGHDKYGFPIFGKQAGNKFKVKGAKKKFDEKTEKDHNFSSKYIDEKGKINVKYYAKYSQKPMSQKEINEKFHEKEKYLEKYYDGENIYQDYTNFHNKTILNFEDNNNSINPGYEI